MDEFDGKNHSLRHTLERLDFDPPVVAGLTGDELFTIALVLQGVSFITVFPLIGFTTGIWVLAFGASLIIGLLCIGFVGRRIAKAKEKKPPDIVWLDIKLFFLKLFGRKSDVFTTNGYFSCDRIKQTKKRGN